MSKFSTIVCLIWTTLNYLWANKNGAYLKRIKCFKKRSFLKVSIIKNVLLKSYYMMKIFFRKIRIILDVQDWLWKSEFWKLLRNRSSSKYFVSKNISAVFTHSYIPSLCKMFFVMRHNIGHSNAYICT